MKNKDEFDLRKFKWKKRKEPYQEKGSRSLKIGMHGIYISYKDNENWYIEINNTKHVFVFTKLKDAKQYALQCVDKLIKADAAVMDAGRVRGDCKDCKWSCGKSCKVKDNIIPDSIKHVTIECYQWEAKCRK